MSSAGAGPSWASLNLGVLVCHQCCSVHRSLGRQLSQMVHVAGHAWNPAVFAVFSRLGNDFANRVWEARATARPIPSDPLVFVRAVCWAEVSARARGC